MVIHLRRELVNGSTPEERRGLPSRAVHGYMLAMRQIGILLALAACGGPEKGVKQVVFDRGGYKYHGRVKAFADGAREGGLAF